MLRTQMDVMVSCMMRFARQNIKMDVEGFEPSTSRKRTFIYTMYAKRARYHCAKRPDTAGVRLSAALFSFRMQNSEYNGA